MEILPNIEPFRSRFHELEKQLSLPETFQDNQLASGISREHRRLSGILELYDKIQSFENQVKECESLIDDPEMGNEARSEILMLNTNIEECKEKLLVSMIPPDPEIGKNIIVE